MHKPSYDHPVAEWLQDHSQACLRAALGLVYVWFGAPKLIPGLSPAEDLVRAATPWFDPAWFVPALGVAEVWIGLCLWRTRWLGLGLVLMALHMAGTCLPLVTLPEVTWRSFPVLTLEGQYILKNAVLIASAMALAGSQARSARSSRRARLASGSPSRTMRRPALRPLPGGRPYRTTPSKPWSARTPPLPPPLARPQLRRAVSLRA